VHLSAVEPGRLMARISAASPVRSLVGQPELLVAPSLETREVGAGETNKAIYSLVLLLTGSLAVFTG